MGLREKARFEKMSFREKAAYIVEKDVETDKSSYPPQEDILETEEAEQEPVANVEQAAEPEKREDEQIIPDKKYSHYFIPFFDLFEKDYPLDIQDVIYKILSSCIKEMAIEKIVLLLLQSGVNDNNKKTYVINGQKGYTDFNISDFKFDETDKLSQYLISQFKPVELRDILSQSDYSAYQVLADKYHLELALPLVFQKNIIGLLLIGGKSSAQNYSKEDYAFLEFISYWAGILIYNSQKCLSCHSKINEEKSYSEYTNKLYHISSLVNSLETKYHGSLPLADSDLTEILKAFFKEIGQLFGVEMASVLLEDENGHLAITESLGLSEDSKQKFVLTKNNESLGEFFNQSTPILLSNYLNNSEIIIGLSDIDMSAIHFFLLIPLEVSGHLFGAMNILKLKDKNISSTDQKEFYLFQIVSSYLSHLLYNFLGYVSDIVVQSDELVDEEDLKGDDFNSLLAFIEKEIQQSELKDRTFTLFLITLTNVTRYISINGIKKYNHLAVTIINRLRKIVIGRDYLYRSSLNKFALFVEDLDEDTLLKKENEIKIILQSSFNEDFKPGFEPYSISRITVSPKQDPYSFVTHLLV